MLNDINAFRTGPDAWYWNTGNLGKKYPKCGELKWDNNLEEIAKVRAKEISRVFSHVRPNGRICFTTESNGVHTWGENIAKGETSAAQVFQDWQENNNLYAGQGHRRNMLNSKFKTIGIAHYVDSQGMSYWVQEFGY